MSFVKGSRMRAYVTKLCSYTVGQTTHTEGSQVMRQLRHYFYHCHYH